jgi:afadin
MMQFFAVAGSIMFHVRRRPADYHPRKRKKKPQQKWNKGSELMEYRYEDGYDRLPFFLELNPGMLHFKWKYSLFMTNIYARDWNHNC